MIKKITFVIFICCVLFSCGKKGDPTYKASKEKIKFQTIFVDKI